MVTKQLLIAGIDPGTTTAYAVLDLDGRPVAMGSSKRFGLNHLLMRLMGLGRIIAVSTDRKSTPHFVSKVAVKLGSRLIVPGHDLLSEEKRLIAKGHMTRNEHERDALASALYAYKRMRPLITKTRKFMDDENKPEILSQVMEQVIRNGKKGIRTAMQSLAEAEKPISQGVQAAIKPKIEGPELLKIRKALKAALVENLLLKNYNDALKQQIYACERKEQEPLRETESPDKRMKKTMAFKEHRIISLQAAIDAREQKQRKLEEGLALQNHFLAQLASHAVLKKLRNLSWGEFAGEKKRLSISEGDMLLVNDAGVWSSRTVDELKGKVHVILFTKSPGRELAAQGAFTFLDAQKFAITESHHYALVAKAELERAVHQSGLLHTIVDSYKQERRRQT